MDKKDIITVISDLDKMIKIKTNIHLDEKLIVETKEPRFEFDRKYISMKVHIKRFNPEIDAREMKRNQTDVNLIIQSEKVPARQGLTKLKDFRDSFNEYLKYLNFSHSKIGQYMLISETTPDFDEFWSERSKVHSRTNKIIQTELLPRLGDTLKELHVESGTTYGILLSNVHVNLIRVFDETDNESTLHLKAELIDRKLESVTSFNLTFNLGNDVRDYRDIFWLYEDIDEFSKFKDDIEDYDGDAIDAIDHAIKVGTSLKYDGVTLHLLKFNGLSMKDNFIISNDDGIQYNLMSIMNLFGNHALEGLVKEVSYIDPEEKAVLIEFENGEVIFAGNNGMTSPRIGTIYRPGDLEHGSLMKAKKLLISLIGNNEKLPILLSAFDGRKNRSPLAGKKYSANGLFE